MSSQQLECCDLIEGNADRPEARAGGELNEIAADNDWSLDLEVRSGAILQRHPYAFPSSQLQCAQQGLGVGKRLRRPFWADCRDTHYSTLTRHTGLIDTTCGKSTLRP